MHIDSFMAHAACCLVDALKHHTDQEFTKEFSNRDQELLVDAITDFFCSELDETGAYIHRQHHE